MSRIPKGVFVPETKKATVKKLAAGGKVPRNGYGDVKHQRLVDRGVNRITEEKWQIDGVLLARNQVYEHLCREVAGGRPLPELARIPGYPSMRQIAAWKKVDAAFRMALEEAEEIRGYILAEEVVEDALTATAANASAIKLRMEAKKWLASKFNHRFSDRQVVEHKHEFELLSDDDLKLKLLAAIQADPRMLQELPEHELQALGLRPEANAKQMQANAKQVLDEGEAE